MADAEITYSAGQMTQKLECTPQMAGRYYQAFEKITKQKIKTQGRDGRQFDKATHDVLLASRDLVRSNNGLKIEDAIKRVLLLSTEAFGLTSNLPAPNFAGADSLKAIEALLRANQHTNEALLLEIRGLRQDLKQPNPLAKLNTPVSQEDMLQVSKPGVFVRFAAWVESVLRK